MYQIINNIRNCKRASVFKRIYLEAQICELLILQLEQFLKVDNLNSSLKKEDQEKIYAVRDYMVNNLDKNSSLLNLALEVDTNEFTLKKGFKELFGTSVFNFWNDKKMEYAKKLLIVNHYEISEVSDILSSRDPRYFSAAFKRKYFINPSELKKRFT